MGDVTEYHWQLADAILSCIVVDRSELESRGRITRALADAGVTEPADTQRLIDEAVAAEREKMISASRFFCEKRGLSNEYDTWIKMALSPGGEIDQHDIDWASADDQGGG